MSNIRLRNVTKRFGSTVTLHQVNLDIEDGEFAVFVGPSGCGKSTLLRMIAGLEEVSEGEVLIGDEVMNDVVPAHRGVAMVFQSYALYPHMTVAENMGYGLKVNGVPKDEIQHQVGMVAKTLQLSHLLDRKPKQLSGGQRQRDTVIDSLLCLAGPVRCGEQVLGRHDIAFLEDGEDVKTVGGHAHTLRLSLWTRGRATATEENQI